MIVKRKVGWVQPFPVMCGSVNRTWHLLDVVIGKTFERCVHRSAWGYKSSRFLLCGEDCITALFYKPVFKPLHFQPGRKACHFVMNVCLCIALLTWVCPLPYNPSWQIGSLFVALNNYLTISRQSPRFVGLLSLSFYTRLWDAAYHVHFKPKFSSIWLKHLQQCVCLSLNRREIRSGNYF